MLCKADLASMAELLDINGVWTTELLELMLPVAIDAEADDTSRMFGATAAAVSLIGGKQGAHAFTEGIKSTKNAARQAMRKARGLAPETVAPPVKGETPAEQFMGLMGSIGIRARSKRNTGKPTRKH